MRSETDKCNYATFFVILCQWLNRQPFLVVNSLFHFWIVAKASKLLVFFCYRLSVMISKPKMLFYVMLWYNPKSILPARQHRTFSRRIRRLQAIRHPEVCHPRQSQHALLLINRWGTHPDSQGQTIESVSQWRQKMVFWSSPTSDTVHETVVYLFVWHEMKNYWWNSRPRLSSSKVPTIFWNGSGKCYS
jgi:hypothetical protein